MLKRLDKKSELEINNSQVVIDLKGAVKELVENSLDAHASKIEVKFYDHGKNGIEVADNGCGVKEQDFDIIAKRGTTSKISEVDDIYKIKTLGFRGEALSALCLLGELTISTKREDADLGYSLSFDDQGNLTDKKQIARNVSKT